MPVDSFTCKRGQRGDPYAGSVAKMAREHRLLSIHWEVTYRCNETCSHCYLDVLPPGVHPPDELTTDEAKQLLDQAVDITRQHGGKFVLLVVPIRSQTLAPDPNIEAHYQQVMSAFARAKGIPEIDLLRAFVENRDDGLFVDDYHPTEIGHSIAAIEMLEQLDAQAVLPR